MAFIELIGILAGLDIIIKSEVEDRASAEFPRAFDKKGIITLHKSHNKGLPFGFLKKYESLVRMLPTVTASALGGIFLWLMQKKGHVLEKLAVSVTLAGALSNLHDRLVRGYVVDYFSVNWKGLKKIIFNLGDIFIFIGTILMVICQLKED